MIRRKRNWWKLLVMSVLLGLSPQLMAQKVIFPQEKQAGVAQATEVGDVFTLKNDLLEASFTKVNGKLVFDGCEALDLMAGDELFKLQVDNGKEVLASQMKLVSVKLLDLTPDAKAVRASLKMYGKAIEAKYTYSPDAKHDLDITWRAVLRDGSHYLRTELDLKANKDTKMFSIVPLLYTVDNLGNKQAPAVVGNTRGAILMSDKLFAGVETPTAYNSVESATGGNDVKNFNYKEWSEALLAWKPGKMLPAGVKALGFTEDEVVGARGYLLFTEKGEHTLTFTYGSGTHGLNIVGVDLLDMDGNVLDKDYHVGFAGGKLTNNVYKLTVPEAKCYMVRYFVETKTETITGTGSIAYNHKVVPAEVVFDLVEKPMEPRAAAKRVEVRAMGTTIGANETLNDAWTAETWKALDFDMPFRIGELGYKADQVAYADRPLEVTSVGQMKVTFAATEGQRLNLIGVALIDAQDKEAAYHFEKGYTEKGGSSKNVYTLTIPNKGQFKLRYYVAKGSNAQGTIKVELEQKVVVHLPAASTTNIQGLWRRNVVLKAGKTWNVSAVVGLVAEGQPRRSVLAYVERERAVPWRAYPVYISWYELNINRNNDINYDGNMHDYQCTEIVKEWQHQLYDRYGVGVKAFVWDDGWDVYGTWKFNKNFPNGFKQPDLLARAMDSGIGAWLGPVGGYGQSGNYRRDYWSDKGGMQLSNPDYYKVFYDACSGLIHDYDFRFFKFDGISGQFSSVGPDPESKNGNENAEAIIYAEQDMRRVKPDIFFNTTVGTWASPFWFHITDAVWRQENDYGEMGDNSNSRERWITYRDNLVHQNFVQRSPMCPINCLMTHGFILSDFGPVSKDRDYDAIVREMRCAFACGSGMVELYNDFKLMNTVTKAGKEPGALWGELAKCIEWQKKNEDVLPDAHWVGGDPWTGSEHQVYGWAAWNGKDAVMTLRNGDNNSKTFVTTLRKALEIPAYVKGEITLNKAFDDQADLKGLTTGTPIDIDAELTLELPGSSVYVFDNTQPKVIENYRVTGMEQLNNITAYTVKSETMGYLTYNATDEKYLHATATNVEPEGVENEQFALVHHYAMPEGEYYMYAMGANRFLTPEGDKVRLTKEPMVPVTLTKVNENEKTTFVLTFGENQVLTLAATAAEGVKLVAGGAQSDANRMVLTAVNHKARLTEARMKTADIYMYERLDRTDWTVNATAGTAAAGGQPELLLDGQLNTAWLSGEGVKMPYVLTLDMQRPTTFCALGWQASMDKVQQAPVAYNLYVSDDNVRWKLTKMGELKWTDREFQWMELGKTVEARYLRLDILSNGAGNDQVQLAELYVGYDGSEVTPELFGQPWFSTETEPEWYPMTFKKGNCRIEDKGDNKIMKTANAAEVDAQLWQFIGNESGFLMKSKKGNYVVAKGDRFYTTSDKTKASTMEFIQSSKFYLELRVKGASKCMNQFGGAGADKDLGAWNQSDPGNLMLVGDVEVPRPMMPAFSKEQHEAWYMIQFANGGRVIEDKGLEKSARLAEATGTAAQAWKLVGNRNKFQLMNAKGEYLVVSKKEETQAGQNAGKNPNPLRTSKEPFAPGFKLVETEGSYAPAWEIQPNNVQGKCLNQHGANAVGNTIGVWTMGDGNNPLAFVPVCCLTMNADGYTTCYSDKAFTMPEGVRGTMVKEVKAGENGIGMLMTEWEFMAGDIVPAMTALLLQGDATRYFCTYLKEDIPSDEVANMLKGTLKDELTENEVATKYYRMGYKEVNGVQTLGFFYGAEDGAAFTNVGGTAYLAVGGTSPQTGYYWDDMVTGIDDVEMAAEDSTVYTLMGVQLQGSVDELPEGVYIVNGQKVVVK